MTTQGYDAFISYSHEDATAAGELHAALERYGKRWRQGRRLRIFRDKSNLAVTSALWDTIRGELENSRFLLVIASPSAAGSPWVEKEVAWWLHHRSAETILLVLVEGALDWNGAEGSFRGPNPTVLPASLEHAFASEPRYVDLRWAASDRSRRVRDPRFEDAVAELSAALQGLTKDALIGEHLKAQRRALQLAVGTSAILLVLLGVAIALGFMAQTQGARAARRFGQVRELANWLNGEFHQSIVNLAGATKARQDLVTKGMHYLDTLAEDAGDDPGLQLDLARGYDRQAHFLGDPYGPNLGDMPGARQSYEKSLHILRSLPPAWRDDVGTRRLANNVQSSLAVQQGLRTRDESARVLFDAVIREGEALVALEPAEALGVFRSDLSFHHHRYGDFLNGIENLDAARTEFERALEVARGLVRDFPQSSQYGRDLAQLLGKNAVAVARTDPPGAYRLQREGMEELERLHELDPDNAQLTSDLAQARSVVAVMAQDLGEIDESRATWRLAVEARRRLVTADPMNARAYGDMSIAARGAALVEIQTEHVDDAYELLATAQTFGEEWFRAAPHDRRSGPELALTHAIAGGAYSSARPKDAERAFSRILELHATLERPDVERRALAVQAHVGLATSGARQGRWQEIGGHLDSAQTIARSIVTDEPGNLEALWDLAEVVSMQGFGQRIRAAEARSPGQQLALLTAACELQREAVSLGTRAGEAGDPKQLDFMARNSRECDHQLQSQRRTR